MEKYICIHGHFYQPPRENPWLEAVELQDSAYPYHDWNFRINAECYATNGWSRILDDQGRILEIINNYAKISFNFGPTLLAWLEDQAPRVYEAILEGDRLSREHFSGHGSALAQPYNHMIMPLADPKDKRTQVLWGIRDFEHRFGREPEGMWLPETAVDVETLDILSDMGIGFTILAPHQAKRVRLGDGNWQDVNNGGIDPAEPYSMRLPSGRKITLFFYDGPLSRAVAFEGLLSNGETFAHRLLDGFSGQRSGDQLVHIATDGESYGHHHRFGDMALAYALHYIDSNGLASITNYGEYLESHPPNREVEIFENTSWSCVHGIERWRSDCGCHTGGRPDWSQGWRTPLRESLDRLRDAAGSIYQGKGTGLFQDPWSARDEYIRVILDRRPENVTRFLEQHTSGGLPEEATSLALKLLEMQRHAMLMYTSCGWFFDDLSGIETVQIIQYAGRVLQLCKEVSGEDLEPRFLDILEKAKSNLTERGNGREIYESAVKPAMVDLWKVAAHYAMSSLFEEYGDQESVYCYEVDCHSCREWEAGRAKLSAGRATVTSQITLDSATFCFGVLHLGDHNISCGISHPPAEAVFDGWVANLSERFGSADFVSAFAELEKDFGPHLYTLRDLFRDQQRKLLDIVLDTTLEDAKRNYRQLYDYHAPLLRFLKDLDIPPPKALYTAGEFILNLSLREIFEGEEGVDVDSARSLLEEVAMEGVALDEPTLEIAVRRKIETLMERFSENPKDTDLLQWLEDALEIQAKLPFEVNLRKAQNIYYEMLQERLQDPAAKEEQEHPSPEWRDRFESVGRKLSFWIP